MSKLAHSNQETMDEIERQAREDEERGIPREPPDEPNGWHPIATMPREETQVLACVADDGRMMIWNTKILWHSLMNKTPRHLQFPATHWMPLPKVPKFAGQ